MRAASLLVLIGLAALAQTRPGAAQSAYDYPWCAIYGDKSGAQACYYVSYPQCMATLSGIGGTCIRSPYYRGPVRDVPRGERRRRYD
jgi:hypothetical protein